MSMCRSVDNCGFHFVVAVTIVVAEQKSGHFVPILHPVESEPISFDEPNADPGSQHHKIDRQID